MFPKRLFPILQGNGTQDWWCLELCWLEIRRNRVLKYKKFNNKNTPQSFPIFLAQPRQQKSGLDHNIITIDWAIPTFHTHGLCLCPPQPFHLYYRQIQAIIRHQTAFLTLKTPWHKDKITCKNETKECASDTPKYLMHSKFWLQTNFSDFIKRRKIKIDAFILVRCQA
jgi:hypothetical protein